MSQTKAQLIEGTATQELSLAKATLGAGTAGAPALTTSGDTNTGIFFPAADTIGFAEGGAEAARIDSSGRLLVGTSTSPSSGNGTLSRLVVQGYVGGATGTGIISLQRGATVSSAGDELGRVAFNDSDGNTFAHILAESDAASGSNDYPGRLTFSTTADGASSPTERLKISSSGDLIVGSSSSTTNYIYNNNAAAKLHLSGGGSGSANIELHGASHTTPKIITFSTDNAERMRITSEGRVYLVQVGTTFTTGSGANVNVDAGDGQLRRSTSSIKYKTDVETLDDSYADALLACRPVWYRSTCEGDNPEHSWWGFIAEEVAAIDPRLVHWKTVEVTYDDNGSAVSTPCDPEPEGVAYERFVPHLLNLIKRQGEAIAELQTEVAALKAQ